jgi:hypothetical protein
VPKSGAIRNRAGRVAARGGEAAGGKPRTNGNINWDEGFLILIDFMRSTLSAEASFSDAERHAINSDLDRLRDFTPVG